MGARALIEVFDDLVDRPRVFVRALHAERIENISQRNSLLRQMESAVDEIEAKMLKQFGAKILYTFVQTRNSNSGNIMARLKNKGDMSVLWKEMEKAFPNTPLISFNVEPWNPGEMPIPNPPKLKISVDGSDPVDRQRAAQELKDLIQEHKLFDQVYTRPEVGHEETVVLSPRLDLWPALRAGGGSRLEPQDIADIARVATEGRMVARMNIKGRSTQIVLKYPDGTVSSVEDLAALPIGLKSKVVPLKALAEVKQQTQDPATFREDGRDALFVYAKPNEANKATGDESLKKAKEWVTGKKFGKTSFVHFEDAEFEIHDALKQLGTAVGLSILLIFLTLFIQFGDVVSALLVLVAIPLGLIGVVVSLFVFRSTLSLNSILGVILLNGIAVANSIILIDFIRRLVAAGMAPIEAAAEAARKRLRPILITSLTTILGMMPIALGMGEGGKILQPLGIAVSGGLWVSMGLTLFVVPALQVRYLDWQQRGRSTLKSSSVALGLATQFKDEGAPASELRESW